MMVARARSGMSLMLLVGLLAGVMPAAASAAVTVLAGQTVFGHICFACHGDKGQGTVGIAPVLAGSLVPVFKQVAGRDYIARVLIYGLSGRIISQGQTYAGAMPIHTALSDTELADVANYLAQDLNGVTQPVFTAELFSRTRSLNPSPTHKELRELRSRVMP
jgi:mono/diheme cytochrome c family protein